MTEPIPRVEQITEARHPDSTIETPHAVMKYRAWLDREGGLLRATGLWDSTYTVESEDEDGHPVVALWGVPSRKAPWLPKRASA